VLEALPVELREQVERSWSDRDGRPSNHQSPSPQPSSPRARPTSPPHPPALYAPPVGTLLLQIPNQPDSLGIVLELPSFSQVRKQPFLILPFADEIVSEGQVVTEKCEKYQYLISNAQEAPFLY